MSWFAKLMSSILPEMLLNKALKIFFGDRRSNFLLILFLLVSFISLPSAFCQDEEKKSDFQFEVLSFQTSRFTLDSARADIYVSVPYSWIMFLNAGDKY